MFLSLCCQVQKGRHPEEALDNPYDPFTSASISASFKERAAVLCCPWDPNRPISVPFTMKFRSSRVGTGQSLPLPDLLKLVLRPSCLPEIFRRYIWLVGDREFPFRPRAPRGSPQSGIQLFYKLRTHNYKFSCRTLRAAHSTWEVYSFKDVL